MGRLVVLVDNVVLIKPYEIGVHVLDVGVAGAWLLAPPHS